MKSLSRLLPLCLLLFTPSLHAELLTVEALRGDGIYSMLRRYHLIEHGCNVTEFRRLNRLSANSKLLTGRLYKLPVEVVVYDGKSIRSSTDNNDWDRAVAIKNYNELLLQDGLRSKGYESDNLLYLPHHIDHCSEVTDREVTESTGGPDAERTIIAAPKQETTTADRTFSIFGPQYATVPLIDRVLAGRIFYVVAGHGGPDPGSVGKLGGKLLAEDEYAYDVALRLSRNILQHGGIPYMIVRDENDGIRDDRYLGTDKDETIWGGDPLPRNQKARLFQRSDIINSLYEENLAKGITDQTMISIHIDSRHRGQRVDVFLYYPEGDEVGKRRALAIRTALSAKYKQYRPGRGYSGSVRSRDLHMLRETKPAGVFIELGNITNASDQQRIVNPSNRQLLADWLLLGLIEDQEP